MPALVALLYNRSSKITQAESILFLNDPLKCLHIPKCAYYPLQKMGSLPPLQRAQLPIDRCMLCINWQNKVVSCMYIG